MCFSGIVWENSLFVTPKAPKAAFTALIVSLIVALIQPYYLSLIMLAAAAHEPSNQYQYTTYISAYVNGGRTRSEQQAIFNDMQQQQNDMLQQVNDCMNNDSITPSLAEQECDIDTRIHLLRQQQQRFPTTTTRSNNSNSTSWSSIFIQNVTSFIEDITTCCWHVDLICGLDNEEEEAIRKQKAKERRKNSIDDTFMGKVISCAPLRSCGGHNSCGAVRGVVIDDDTTIATTPSSVSRCLDEI